MRKLIMIVCVMAIFVSYGVQAFANVTPYTNGTLYSTRVDQATRQFCDYKNVIEGKERQQAAFWNPISFSATSGCLGSACGLSGCIGSGCVLSGCLGSFCESSGCGGSACIVSGCAGSACGASLCAGSVCLGSACAGSACSKCP